jgi:hypothetical protein
MADRLAPMGTKVGTEFYSAYAEYDPTGNPKYYISVNTWVVSSIKNVTEKFGIPQYMRSTLAKTNPELIKRTVYLVKKTKFTWIPTGFGDREKWGWSKSIRKDDRKNFGITEQLPYGVFTTERQALMSCNEKIKLHIERCQNGLKFPPNEPDEHSYFEDEIKGNTKLLAMIKSRITKLKTKKEKKNGK